MKRQVFIRCGFVPLLLLSLSLHVSAVKHVILTSSFTFNPSTLNVLVGDTVRWVWVNGSHTTTSTTIPPGAAAWNSPLNSTVPSFEYKVTVAGVHNYKCTPHAGFMFGSFTATAPPALTVTVTATPNTILAGQTSQLLATATGGTGIYTYSWSSVPTGFSSTLQNPAVSPVVTTVYSCLVSSGAQTSSNSATVTVNQPVPAILDLGGITVGNGDNLCYNATQTITVAGNSGSFLVEAGGIATMIAGQTIVFQPGISVVAGGKLTGYIAPGGPYCNPPAAFPQGVGISQNEAIPGPVTDAITVWPNPTTGAFTLDLQHKPSGENIRVEIYSIRGERVHTGRYDGSGTIQLTLEGAMAGLYLVRIDAGNRVSNVRMVKL